MGIFFRLIRKYAEPRLCFFAAGEIAEEKICRKKPRFESLALGGGAELFKLYASFVEVDMV